MIFTVRLNYFIFDITYNRGGGVSPLNPHMCLYLNIWLVDSEDFKNDGWLYMSG